MNEMIRKILDLQNIDGELSRIETDLKRYQESLRGRRNEVARLEAAVEKIGQDILHLELQVRESETQVHVWRAEIEKLKKQVMSVQSTKELEALNHEIHERERKISDADEKGLEFLDQEEHLKAELDRQEKSLALRRDECSEEEKRIAGRIEELQDMSASLKAQRPVALEKIDPLLRGRYENLAGRFPGMAVVPIEGTTCGGCHMNVVKSTLQKAAEDGGRLVECTSCRRYMFLTEDDLQKHAS